MVKAWFGRVRSVASIHFGLAVQAPLMDVAAEVNHGQARCAASTNLCSVWQASMAVAIRIVATRRFRGAGRNVACLTVGHALPAPSMVARVTTSSGRARIVASRSHQFVSQDSLVLALATVLSSRARSVACRSHQHVWLARHMDAVATISCGRVLIVAWMAGSSATPVRHPLALALGQPSRVLSAA